MGKKESTGPSLLEPEATCQSGAPDPRAEVGHVFSDLYPGGVVGPVHCAICGLVSDSQRVGRFIPLIGRVLTDPKVPEVM